MELENKIKCVLMDFEINKITLQYAAKEILRLLNDNTRFSEPGFVKIEGCDNATGFERICKESELQKVGKEIFAEHPGEDGYYSFTKFLWVKYPDNRPKQRLDYLVPYD